MEKSCLESGTRDNPPPRDNFTERLYDKTLAQLTEIKLTQLIIPKSYFDVHDLTTPFALRIFC